MSATPVEMAEAQDFPKSAFVVLLEDYRALERQLSEAKGTQIGWMVEGTYNGEEISRTLFALEDREFADLFKENNGGVVKPIYDAPTQMKRSLEPQASAEDRVMTDERKPDASSQPLQAHSKTEYKRMVAQGANVLPPEPRGCPTPGACSALAVMRENAELRAQLAEAERQREERLPNDAGGSTNG